MPDKKLCLDVLHVFFFVGSMAELIHVGKRYVKGFLGKVRCRCVGIDLFPASIYQGAFQCVVARHLFDKESRCLQFETVGRILRIVVEHFF